MAELILTEEEKAAPSYLDWDDDALGKMVRKLAVSLKDKYGADAGFATMAAFILVDKTIQNNGAQLNVHLGNFTNSGQSFGDWRVIVEKVGVELEEESTILDTQLSLSAELLRLARTLDQNNPQQETLERLAHAAERLERTALESQLQAARYRWIRDQHNDPKGTFAVVAPGQGDWCIIDDLVGNSPDYTQREVAYDLDSSVSLAMRIDEENDTDPDRKTY